MKSLKTLAVCIESKDEKVLKDLRFKICMLACNQDKVKFSTTLLDGKITRFEVDDLLSELDGEANG